MLEQGHDSRTLRILSGMTAPLNHFELAELRDRALNDVGAPDAVPQPLVTYAAELLSRGLFGEIDFRQALERVKDLCIAADYHRDLYPFYLLSFAAEDLDVQDVQWYWPGANRENIDQIARAEAEKFIAAARR
jgi:hypothetical protein